MDLKTELLRVRDENGGVLTPERVVEAARPVDHPLHSRFEWDDSIAGEKYREEQARHLIKSVMITYSRDDNPIEVRAFYAVEKAPRSYVYDPTEEIVENPVSLQVVLNGMRRRIKELRAQYGHLKEFAEAVRALAEEVA